MQCAAETVSFGGFVLEDDDINELKSCRPGKCQLQLPTESMEEFQKLLDWSAPDVVAQVNKLAQKMALGELSQYQKDGDSALGTYSDKKYPLRLADQFASLLSKSASMKNYLPDLQRYLIGYPQAASLAFSELLLLGTSEVRFEAYAAHEPHGYLSRIGIVRSGRFCRHQANLRQPLF
jgi:hypothetical protein